MKITVLSFALLLFLSLSFGSSHTAANGQLVPPPPPSPSPHIRLLAPDDIYVNATTGSDSNDGLTTGTKLATAQAAVNLLKAKYDFGGPRANPLVVHIEANETTTNSPVISVSGSFTGQQPSAFVFPSAGEVPVIFRCDPGVTLHSSNAVATVLAVYWASFGIEGCRITSAGHGIETGAGGDIQFADMVFGTVGGYQIFAAHNGLIENYGDFTLEGNAKASLVADYNGALYISNATVNIASNMTVSNAFARAAQSSDFTIFGTTFNLNGYTVTGKRFVAEGGSAITTDTNGNLSYFPGTLYGTFSGWGSYDKKTPWIPWTPTITTSGGNFTALGTVTARYWRMDDRVTVEIIIPIVTNGLGAGYITATLPFAGSSTANSVLFGSEVSTIGIGLKAPIGGNIAFIADMNNNYAGGNGRVLLLTGEYKVP